MADTKGWISMNLTMSIDGSGGSNWMGLWAHVCYYLWFQRNQQVHNDSFIRPVRPWQFIYHQWQLFKEPETSFWKGTAVPKIQIVVTWLPPSQGWTKLNTDGSVQGPQNVTLVGIIRDEKGCWISGF